ncbi:MAG: 2-oxoglutarate synthase [Deltaproteobacteria bacterium]|nr:2-oxoglutarate synthase [Deltaproteobacteria bacterium]
MVFVSGIGCAGWIPSPYFNADTLHTTPGRSVAIATGIKLFRPALKVVVVSGDGDLMALGGNHLLHAARRGVNLTVICVNNGVYEMTGGQSAPGVPPEIPIFGELAPPFDLCDLMRAAGAAYVARWTVFQARDLSLSVQKALLHPGLSFIETVSFCRTHIGGRFGFRSAVEMMQAYRDRSVPVEQVRTLGLVGLRGRWVVGEFTGKRADLPEEEEESLTEVAFSPT